MDASEASNWMCSRLKNDGCLYQDDVVDFLSKSGAQELLRENADGNEVLDTRVLREFKKATADSVVWVVPDRYWRYRVKEDEASRNARG